MNKREIVKKARTKLKEAEGECIHQPGGHWERDDPVFAPLDKGGLDRPFSKCQSCGALIEAKTQVFMGVTIRYYVKVKADFRETEGLL